MITDTEIKWLEEHCPNLKINPERTEVSGDLQFIASYDASTNKFTWFINHDQSAPGEVLTNTYNVLIQKRKSVDDIPTLKIQDEDFTGDVDRHFYDTGSACVCGPCEKYEFLKEEFSFLRYLERFVVPFLYEQSYYDKHSKWPWGEYAHGPAGIFQSFANSAGSIGDIEACLKQLRKDKKWERIRTVLSGKERLTEASKCFCASSNKIMRCHRDVLLAVLRLRAAIRQNAIRLDG